MFYAECHGAIEREREREQTLKKQKNIIEGTTKTQCLVQLLKYFTAERHLICLNHDQKRQRNKETKTCDVEK